MWWLIPMILIIVAALLIQFCDYDDLDEEEHWEDG